MTQPRSATAICASALLAFTTVIAQQPPPAPAPAAPPPTARQAARTDLAGYWVAQVNEDWRWRMMTPPKGDYESLPLSAAGKKAADGWDLTRDAASGALCKAYGAGAIMRLPLRLHVTWADDDTLKVETDAGRQTRLFSFARDAQPGPRSLQGFSVAQWMHVPPPAPARGGGGGRGGAAPAGAGAPEPRPSALKVVTTNLQPGYLRKNGVPYSENATVTEYFDRLPMFDRDYLMVVTVVTDPMYLARQFVTSSQFKREPDASKWAPSPCTIDPPAGDSRHEPYVAQ